MKWMIFLAIVGGAGYFGYKHFYQQRDTSPAASAEAGDAFLSGCKSASKEIPKVDEYCACLKKRGVTSMLMLGAKPAGREAIAACQEQVGYSTPTPGLNPK